MNSKNYFIKNKLAQGGIKKKKLNSYTEIKK